MRRTLLPLLLACASAGAQAPRKIHIDAGHITGPHSATPLNTVGAGRANEGLRADWQAQLATVQREIGFHYLRFHGVLSDDMGVYTEDAHGHPVYNFQYVDALYDAMLADGIRPFVELSFMPAKLASGTQTVFWWRGNITPPKDYAKWNGLIRAFTQHLMDRYGAAEIAKWYFEVWNEPDLHDIFFTGTQAQYFELYRNTATAIKAVCPQCRVGGPATATGWEADWLAFVAQNSAPADFLSTHTYGVTQGAFDADGHAGTVLSTSPESIVGRVRHSRELVDTFNENATQATSKRPPLELHYTEWSSSYTPTDPVHDQYIEAAFILEKLKQTSSLAQSMSYWTFTDIFEENGPPTRPFHGGFGLMNLQGLRKPAFFAYKFLAQLGPDDVATDDAGTWATREPDGSVQVLVWDYTPILPPDGETNQVFYKGEQPAKPLAPAQLEVSGLRDGPYRLLIYRTGYEQNDVYTAYLHLGAPSQLTRAQVAQLQQAANGAPAEERTITLRNGHFDDSLPMHENDTVLLTLTPVR